MDLLEDGQHVWLRSRELGTYLHADKDWLDVSLRRRRASMKAAWVVHIHNVGGAQYVLLHSAAYGRYLASMNNHGLGVEQADYAQWEAQNVRWQAVRVGSGSGDDILISHAVGGLFLRAIRRPGHEYDGVGMDDIDSVSSMRHWVVERIPARQNAPPLPPPTWFPWRWPRRAGFLSCMIPWRMIEHVDNATFRFYGSSVFRLRKQMGSLLFPAHEASNLVLCIRAGVHGRRTPLVVDLPRSSKTLRIVVVIAGTPDHAQLRYPDVNAE